MMASLRSALALAALLAPAPAWSKPRMDPPTPPAIMPLHPLQAVRAFRHGEAYLRCREQPPCNNRTGVTVVEIGPGGGFASMFQVAAERVVRTLREQPLPVHVRGEIKWYSQNSYCQAARLQGVDCHLEPFLSRECAPGSAAGRGRCDALAPAEALRGPSWDSAWWYAMVQAYMLRPNARLLGAIDRVRASLDLWHPADVAVHIRRGDKITDRRARQPANITVSDFLAAALSLVKARRAQCQCTRAAHRCRPAVVFVATDSREGAEAARAWGERHASLLSVRMQSSTVTQQLSGPGIELAMYAKRAHKRAGYDEHAHARLADELLVDLVLLAEARTFVGLCMSQVARAAVAIGLVRGTMRDALVIDADNLPARDRWKKGTEEGWRTVGTPMPAGVFDRETCYAEERARKAKVKHGLGT